VELIDKTKHFVIQSSHPSPLAFMKTNEVNYMGLGKFISHQAFCCTSQQSIAALQGEQMLFQNKQNFEG
jgi:uracil DNA glycosylase